MQSLANLTNLIITNAYIEDNLNFHQTAASNFTSKTVVILWLKMYIHKKLFGVPEQVDQTFKALV